MAKERTINVYDCETKQIETVTITATLKELLAYMAGMQEAYRLLGKKYSLTWQNA